MTRRATSRASSLLLGEAPDVVFHEALDLFLCQLLAEGGHVLAALRHGLYELGIFLGGLPFGVRVIARHELLSLGRVRGAVLPVALRAILQVKSRGVRIARKERDARARDRRKHEAAQDPC